MRARGASFLNLFPRAVFGNRWQAFSRTLFPSVHMTGRHQGGQPLLPGGFEGRRSSQSSHVTLVYEYGEMTCSDCCNVCTPLAFLLKDKTSQEPLIVSVMLLSIGACW